MVAAVLSLAEQLGLSTLAEGVETPGEHAALAQLGCQHVQGYVIAKPMPYDKTLEWISTHQQSLPLTLAIKHGAS
jgi:EAL domain-containing protein (putative c-di-GMP-specific phosphodiesterase class I)